MSGCFGPSAEDQWKEKQLMDHLDKEAKYAVEEITHFMCPYCEQEFELESKAENCRDSCFESGERE